LAGPPDHRLLRPRGLFRRGPPAARPALRRPPDPYGVPRGGDAPRPRPVQPAGSRDRPDEGRDDHPAHARRLHPPLPGLLRGGGGVRPHAGARVRPRARGGTPGTPRGGHPPRRRHRGTPPMTFEHPGGLWLLTLGVPILAFHFYKGRIRKMPVPMLLFWEQVIVEEEQKSAFRRIRHWASLLISLSALVLLTSAVSLPNVKGFTRLKARYALLLDNSPAMAATEAGGRTRAELAVDRARAFLGTLAYGDQASAADLSGWRLPFTADLEGLAGRLAVPRPGLRSPLRDL